MKKQIVFVMTLAAIISACGQSEQDKQKAAAEKLVRDSQELAAKQLEQANKLINLGTQQAEEGLKKAQEEVNRGIAALPNQKDVMDSAARNLDAAKVAAANAMNNAQIEINAAQKQIAEQLERAKAAAQASPQ